MYLGAHMSIAKGFAKAADTAHQIGANTMQFFTRNPRGAKAKELEQEDIQGYLSNVKTFGIGPVLAHAPYIINLASPDPESRNFAVQTIIDDIHRLEQLNVPYLCIHPGNHMGDGCEAGINRIAKGLDQICSRTSGQVMVLLETMAGAGTEIGKTIQEIKMIIETSQYEDRLGLCGDTCHLYAAGYDIKNQLGAFVEEVQQEVGLQKLKAIHLNDSLKPLDSHRDRHASIGEGQLGEAFFLELVSHPKLREVLFILETPGGIEGYKREIALLKKEETPF